MSKADALDPTAWLEEVRSEYWSQLSNPQEEAGGAPYVLFHLGPHAFALDASLCKGIVKRTRVARLPSVPSHVLGVAGIRGEVVSATDPRILLGLPDERGQGKGYFLLVATGHLKAALWVDWVDDVVPIDLERILAGESPWPSTPKGIVVGQWQGRSPPVHVLDGRKYVEASAVRAPA